MQNKAKEKKKNTWKSEKRSGSFFPPLKIPSPLAVLAESYQPPLALPLEVLCDMMDRECHIKINWMVFPLVSYDSLVFQQSF